MVGPTAQLVPEWVTNPALWDRPPTRSSPVTEGDVVARLTELGFVGRERCGRRS